MTRPADQSCANCDYYITPQGECCRYGPTDVGGVGAWPVVSRDDWCPLWNVTPAEMVGTGPAGPAGVNAPQWTASVSGVSPTGGNNGDFWIRQDGSVITLYYKQAGEWQSMMSWNTP